MQTFAPALADPAGAALLPALPTGVRFLDALRIERALRQRVRYRYVQPTVLPALKGWRIVSPCCSRNIDPAGGVIDIAWLEPVETGWRLFRKDHQVHAWVLHASAWSLVDLLDEVCLDPSRKLWP